MRRILITLLLAIPFVSIGQTQGTSSSFITNMGGYGIDSILRIPFRDTAQWNGRYGNLTIRPQDNNLYVRKSGAWSVIPSAGSTGSILWSDTLSFIATKKNLVDSSAQLRIAINQREKLSNKVLSMLGYTATDTTYPTTRALSEFIQVSVNPFMYYAYDRTIDSIDVYGNTTKYVKLYRHSLPALIDSFQDNNTTYTNGYGLQLAGTQFRVDTSQVATQHDLDSVLGAGSYTGVAPILINGAHQISHAASGVTAGVYTKVTVNDKGHVTVGDALAAGDIPVIPQSNVAGLLDTLSGQRSRIATNRQAIIDTASQIRAYTTGQLLLKENIANRLLSMSGATTTDTTYPTSNALAQYIQTTVYPGLNYAVDRVVDSIKITGTAKKYLYVYRHSLPALVDSFIDADTAYTAGSGIGIAGHVISATGVQTESDPIAQAKTVTLTAGNGITVTGASQTIGSNPAFTIINKSTVRDSIQAGYGLLLSGLTTRVDTSIVAKQNGNTMGAAMVIGTNDANLLTLRAAGQNKLSLNNSNGIYRLQNAVSSNYGLFDFGTSSTGPHATRNVADAGAGFGARNINSGSTGDIFYAENNTGIKFRIKQTGKVNVGAITQYTTGGRQALVRNTTSGDLELDTVTVPGTVTSVSGTTDRITVASGTTTPVIDIASTYSGQASISTLGNITSGTWNGSVLTKVDSSLFYTKYRSDTSRTNIYSAIATKIPLSYMGAPSGVAPLNGSGKIETTYLPDAVLGAVNYRGTYAVTTNTPALPTPSGNKGYYYTVTDSGVYSGNGLTYRNGDWIISNGSVWQKVDNNNAVTSVNGLVGAVTISSLPPSGSAGGDLSGTYPNPSVTDNSHNHSISTLTGIQDSLNNKIPTSAYNILNETFANADLTATGNRDHDFSTFNLNMFGNDWSIEGGSTGIGLVSSSGTGLRLQASATSSGAVQLKTDNIATGSTTLQLPSIGGTIPLTVNGVSANTAGAITIPIGTGTVTSVAGTTNRITSTGGATPVIDISSAYVGQSSITTLGTIGSGVWNGTTITKVDSTLFLSKYRGDTLAAGVYSALATKEALANKATSLSSPDNTKYPTTQAVATAISGFISGNQSITFTGSGDVTGSASGTTAISPALTIANNAVTNAKAADMATQTFKGRTTAGTGDPEDLTITQAKTMLGLTGTNTGDQSLGRSGSSITLTGGTSVIDSSRNYNAGTGINITGTYPNYTVAATGIATESDPVATAKTVTLTAGNGITVTGSAQTVGSNPTFTIINKATVRDSLAAGTGISISGNTITNSSPNATHTGDVTGSTALTLATVNSNVGTFNNVVVNAKGLVTAASNVGYLTAEVDGSVSNELQNLGLGTTTSTTQPLTISSGTGTTLPAATNSLAGLLTAADKTKLDGIAAGATANAGTVTSVGLTMPTGFTVGGSPVTSSGTIGVTSTLNGYVKGNGSSSFTASTTIPYSDITGTPSLSGYELLFNKATSLSSPDNTKYPTTLAVSSAISGLFTLPSLTSGSVLFSNGSTISQDNSTFFWDNTNKRLGIGTSSPTDALQVATNQNAGVGLTITNSNGSSAAAAGLNFKNNDNSVQSSIFATSSTYGSYGVLGPSVAGVYSTSKIAIAVDGGLESFVVGVGGGVPERFRILPNGNAGFGTATPAQKLDVAGTIRQSGVTSSLLKANSSGDIVAAVAGTDFLAASDYASGTYTPTVSPAGTGGTFTAAGFTYTKVKNVVTVYGRVDASGYTGGSILVDVTLPVASAFASDSDLNGVVSGLGVSSGDNYVKANTGSTGTARLVFQSGSLTAKTYISFMYKIQ